MRKPMEAKNITKVVLRGYYNLDGDYLHFSDNELHGKTFNNADVTISQEERTIAGISFAVDIVSIKGHEPIECELVDYRFTADGTLEISICQDWG